MPIDAIRGGSLRIGPRMASRVLVTLQFFSASVLLILLLVINSQNTYLKVASARGTDYDVILLTDDGSREIGYEALADDLASQPSVAGLSYIDYLPWSDHENFLTLSRAPDGRGDYDVAFYNQIGYDFFEYLGAELIAGRVFEKERGEAFGTTLFGGAGPEDVVPVVVDREFVEIMGFASPAEAAGQDVFLSEQFQRNFSTNPTIRIVGVIESMPMVIAASGTSANIYALSDTRYGFPIVFARKGSVPAALEAINTTVRARNPNALVATLFLDDAFDTGFRTFDGINGAFVLLSSIAMVISLLGLIGMAAYATSKRRNEIGVRKTLGSSATRVIALLLFDFSKPVVIGNLLAWPVAYLGAKLYLDNFITSVELTPIYWVAGFVVTTAVAALAVIGPSYAAASVPPSDALRHE